MTGRSPSGRAFAPSASSQQDVSPVPASIPNASLRYEFLTPYHRGFDLVWDFLCAQPNGQFSDGVLTIKGSYGYERARNLALLADGQQIGHHTELWERFAALGPVFQGFWRTFERAAKDWRKEQERAEVEADAEQMRLDDELCLKVLTTAKAIEAGTGETAKQARSEGRKRGAARHSPNPHSRSQNT